MNESPWTPEGPGFGHQCLERAGAGAAVGKQGGKLNTSEQWETKSTGKRLGWPVGLGPGSLLWSRLLRVSWRRAGRGQTLDRR